MTSKPRSQLYQGLALPNKAIIPASPCKVGLRQILCNIVYFYFAKNNKKREEGKPYKVAVINCANKLLQWIYALLKSNSTFQDID
jgi:hypothetical protein